MTVMACSTARRSSCRAPRAGSHASANPCTLACPLPSQPRLLPADSNGPLSVAILRSEWPRLFPVSCCPRPSRREKKYRADTTKTQPPAATWTQTRQTWVQTWMQSGGRTSSRASTRRAQHAALPTPCTLVRRRCGGQAQPIRECCT
jgi:hypothetical protein